MLLQDKVAIITGSSRGIGLGIARELALEGARVVISGRNAERAEAASREVEQAGGTAIAVPADVSIAEQAKALIYAAKEKWERVDILVNNAGITRDNLMLRMSEEDWDAVLTTNLKGAFNCIKAVSRMMMKQRWGRIINITSVVGIMGNAGQANYAASKAGLIGLTRSVAREFASRNITCNAVAPGFIETDMTAALPESAQEALKEQIPLGRFGQVFDIAKIVAFLAGDGGAYITGQVFNVDGGMVMS